MKTYSNTFLAVHQQDFGTAIDYRPHSEAILRHIASPMADRVAEILQQVQSQLLESPEGATLKAALESGDEDALRSFLEN